MKEYLTAILFLKQDFDSQPSAKKYRGIENTERAILKFERFALMKFPNASHVNYYNKITRRFEFQHRF